MIRWLHIPKHCKEITQLLLIHRHHQIHVNNPLLTTYGKKIMFKLDMMTSWHETFSTSLVLCVNPPVSKKTQLCRDFVFSFLLVSTSRLIHSWVAGSLRRHDEFVMSWWTFHESVPLMSSITIINSWYMLILNRHYYSFLHGWCHFRSELSVHMVCLNSHMVCQVKSVPLSEVPVVVHCYGRWPICSIWACPWATNLSNLS